MPDKVENLNKMWTKRLASETKTTFFFPTKKTRIRKKANKQCKKDQRTRTLRTFHFGDDIEKHLLPIIDENVEKKCPIDFWGKPLNKKEVV